MASADTQNGPSLGMGRLPEQALTRALEPFEGVIEELLATVPDDFHWARRASRE